MSLSGSPLVVGVPGCACLEMDPVRVMQISACLVEPLGVTAFGRTEHHPELLRVHKENHLSFSMVQCALTVRLAPLLTQGEMGQQRKMLTPVPHFTFTS